MYYLKKFAVDMLSLAALHHFSNHYFTKIVLSNQM